MRSLFLIVVFAFLSQWLVCITAPSDSSTSSDKDFIPNSDHSNGKRNLPKVPSNKNVIISSIKNFRRRFTSSTALDNDSSSSSLTSYEELPKFLRQRKLETAHSFLNADFYGLVVDRVLSTHHILSKISEKTTYICADFDQSTLYPDKLSLPPVSYSRAKGSMKTDKIPLIKKRHFPHKRASKNTPRYSKRRNFVKPDKLDSASESWSEFEPDTAFPNTRFGLVSPKLYGTELSPIKRRRSLGFTDYTGLSDTFNKSEKKKKTSNSSGSVNSNRRSRSSSPFSLDSLMKNGGSSSNLLKTEMFGNNTPRHFSLSLESNRRSRSASPFSLDSPMKNGRSSSNLLKTEMFGNNMATHSSPSLESNRGSRSASPFSLDSLMKNGGSSSNLLKTEMFGNNMATHSSPSLESNRGSRSASPFSLDSLMKNGGSSSNLLKTEMFGNNTPRHFSPSLESNRRSRSASPFSLDSPMKNGRSSSNLLKTEMFGNNMATHSSPSLESNRGSRSASPFSLDSLMKNGGSSSNLLKTEMFGNNMATHSSPSLESNRGSRSASPFSLDSLMKNGGSSSNLLAANMFGNNMPRHFSPSLESNRGSRSASPFSLDSLMKNGGSSNNLLAANMFGNNMPRHFSPSLESNRGSRSSSPFSLDSLMKNGRSSSNLLKPEMFGNNMPRHFSPSLESNRRSRSASPSSIPGSKKKDNLKEVSLPININEPGTSDNTVVITDRKALNSSSYPGPLVRISPTSNHRKFDGTIFHKNICHSLEEFYNIGGMSLPGMLSNNNNVPMTQGDNLVQHSEKGPALSNRHPLTISTIMGNVDKSTESISSGYKSVTETDSASPTSDKRDTENLIDFSDDLDGVSSINPINHMQHLINSSNDLSSVTSKYFKPIDAPSSNTVKSQLNELQHPNNLASVIRPIPIKNSQADDTQKSPMRSPIRSQSRSNLSYTNENISSMIPNQQSSVTVQRSLSPNDKQSDPYFRKNGPSSTGAIPKHHEPFQNLQQNAHRENSISNYSSNPSNNVLHSQLSGTPQTHEHLRFNSPTNRYTSHKSSSFEANNRSLQPHHDPKHSHYLNLGSNYQTQPLANNDAKVVENNLEKELLSNRKSKSISSISPPEDLYWNSDESEAESLDDSLHHSFNFEGISKAENKYVFPEPKQEFDYHKKRLYHKSASLSDFSDDSQDSSQEDKKKEAVDYSKRSSPLKKKKNFSSFAYDSHYSYNLHDTLASSGELREIPHEVTLKVVPNPSNTEYSLPDENAQSEIHGRNEAGRTTDTENQKQFLNTNEQGTRDKSLTGNAAPSVPGLSPESIREQRILQAKTKLISVDSRLKEVKNKRVAEKTKDMVGNKKEHIQSTSPLSTLRKKSVALRKRDESSVGTRPLTSISQGLKNDINPKLPVKSAKQSLVAKKPIPHSQSRLRLIPNKQTSLNPEPERTVQPTRKAKLQQPSNSNVIKPVEPRGKSVISHTTFTERTLQDWVQALPSKTLPTLPISVMLTFFLSKSPKIVEVLMTQQNLDVQLDSLKNDLLKKDNPNPNLNLDIRKICVRAVSLIRFDPPSNKMKKKLGFTSSTASFVNQKQHGTKQFRINCGIAVPKTFLEADIRSLPSVYPIYQPQNQQIPMLSSNDNADTPIYVVLQWFIFKTRQRVVRPFTANPILLRKPSMEVTNRNSYDVESQCLDALKKVIATSLIHQENWSIAKEDAEACESKQTVTNLAERNILSMTRDDIGSVLQHSLLDTLLPAFRYQNSFKTENKPRICVYNISADLATDCKRTSLIISGMLNKVNILGNGAPELERST